MGAYGYISYKVITMVFVNIIMWFNSLLHFIYIELQSDSQVHAFPYLYKDL